MEHGDPDAGGRVTENQDSVVYCLHPYSLRQAERSPLFSFGSAWP